MKLFLAGLLTSVVLVPLGFSQGQNGLQKAKHAAVVADSSPVTQAEAKATFDRIGGLFKTVLHVSVPAFKIKGSAGSPVQRGQVIEEMGAMRNATKAAFVITPKPLQVEAGRLVFDQPNEAAVLTSLVKGGFVGNYGPLAAGKKRTLTTQEFGDCLGYFVARISQCTYTPSSKWTPFLHN